jgi:hypothetical protein
VGLPLLGVASAAMADEQADLAELIKLLGRAVAWQERTGSDPDASAIDPGARWLETTGVPILTRSVTQPGTR